MDVSSINSDLIRGNVTTIILKALLDEDRYGYDILREIEVKSGGQYKLKQPTLYSCLKRLEKQGLISSYWGDESDTEGGRRRYYALTEAGKTILKKCKASMNTHARFWTACCPRTNSTLKTKTLLSI